MTRPKLRTVRFGLMLSPTDSKMLDLLAEHHDASASEVVRNLVKREAKRVLDLTPADLAKPAKKATRKARK